VAVVEETGWSAHKEQSGVAFDGRTKPGTEALVPDVHHRGYSGWDEHMADHG